MKKTNRQLMVGSLQPLLFCIGMYFVVLIFSVLVCSSIYKTFKSKHSYAVEKKAEPAAASDNAMMASLGK